MPEITLKPGFMSTRDLASWFGISYDYFRTRSRKKYAELEENHYCKFTKVYGGISISEVYRETYMPDIGTATKIASQYIEQYWNLEQPETASRVARAILEDHPEIKLVEKTLSRAISERRKELWGDGGPGLRGGARKVFVKMFYTEDPGGRRYELLTEEEEKIKTEIRRRYFSMPIESDLDIALDEFYREGRPSEEVLLSVFKVESKESGRSAYLSYLKELSGAIGCDYLVKATYCKDGVYYIEEIDENGFRHIRKIQVETPGAF